MFHLVWCRRKRSLLDFINIRGYHNPKAFQEFYLFLFCLPLYSSLQVCKTFLFSTLLLYLLCFPTLMVRFVKKAASRWFPSFSRSLQVSTLAYQKENEMYMNLLASSIILQDQKCSKLTKEKGTYQRNSIVFQALKILKFL